MQLSAATGGGHNLQEVCKPKIPEPQFEDRHRIEVVWCLLQKVLNHPSDLKKRGIESLLEHRIYLAAYPLHEGSCNLAFHEGLSHGIPHGSLSVKVSEDYIVVYSNLHMQLDVCYYSL